MELVECGCSRVFPGYVFAVADGMDDGCEGHQESYFAMYGAKMRVAVPVKPANGGCDSGDCRQQKRPPQNARDGVFVLGETREPVAASVMEVNVI